MKKKWLLFSLTIYILFVLYITLISRTPYLIRKARWIPFQLYYEWFMGDFGCGKSILLNIVLFIPLGYFFAELRMPQKLGVFLFFLLSLVIEIVQYITSLGIFEVDDLISNTLGSACGFFLFWYVMRKAKNIKRYAVVIQVLLLFAGLSGCFLVMNSNQIYETQFYFDITNIVANNDNLFLSGNCFIYNREPLDYYIQVKNGDKTYQAKTTIIGNSYEAIVEAPRNEEKEVEVVFSGYNPISTKTFIKNETVNYVKDSPIPNVVDSKQINKYGKLKAYNSEYDVYIYQKNDMLYWLIGKETEASIIYHIYTNDIQKLLPNRRQYGFENRSFQINSEKRIDDINYGRYMVFCDIIPTNYNISAIMVGMNQGPALLWNDFFRVSQDEMDNESGKDNIQ